MRLIKRLWASVYRAVAGLSPEQSSYLSRPAKLCVYPLICLSRPGGTFCQSCSDATAMPVTARAAAFGMDIIKIISAMWWLLFFPSGWLFWVVWEGMFKNNTINVNNIHMRISLFLWSFCTESSTCFTHLRLKIMQSKWCCPEIQK